MCRCSRSPACRTEAPKAPVDLESSGPICMGLSKTPMCVRKHSGVRWAQCQRPPITGGCAGGFHGMPASIALDSDGARMNWDVLLHNNQFELRRRGRMLVAELAAPHLVLSTSLCNGGQTTHVRFLLNHQSCEGTGHHERFREIIESGNEGYHERVCGEAGVPPAATAMMATAANMNYAAVVTRADGDVTVTAVVTAGVEGNATCAGDPAAGRGSRTRPVRDHGRRADRRHARAAERARFRATPEEQPRSTLRAACRRRRTRVGHRPRSDSARLASDVHRTRCLRAACRTARGESCGPARKVAGIPRAATRIRRGRSEGVDPCRACAWLVRKMAIHLARVLEPSALMLTLA